MFQNLQHGSQIYLLHKGMTPYIEMGTVETMPQMLMGYYPQMSFPLDITVKVGEKVIPFKQLPPSAEIANVIQQGSGEEICVACSKEAVNAEVQQMIQKSVDAINSVEAHRQRIETCKNLLNQLNPEKVKEAQQAQEIIALKDKLASMEQMMADLLKGRNDSSKTED